MSACEASGVTDIICAPSSITNSMNTQFIEEALKLDSSTTDLL